MARWIGSAGGAGGATVSVPSTLASFEPCPAGSAPASASRLASRSIKSSGTSAVSSSSSHSRQLCSSPPMAEAVTRSSQNSASAVPSEPCSTCTLRRVLIRATGESGRSRTMASTTSRSSSGTVSVAVPSGVRTSVRVSVPAGSFRCQPASGPPVRRRSVMRCAARSRSGVSKYTASRCWVSVRATSATAERPSNEGETVFSVTANFRSTSVYLAVLDLPGAIVTFAVHRRRKIGWHQRAIFGQGPRPVSGHSRIKTCLTTPVLRAMSVDVS
ncbi:hypothetical protein BN970_04927 [Mycolicibacterium conceptionense]|uniref:Uncharacterized protein n=1 Tax=Mycolicibacterium conceptionense TaxID=451644 RepID=A0A0U1DQX5_9MYCO|nr:hypothetical protein BN970_04927 [Mycolicibacterium conceptionense]